MINPQNSEAARGGVGFGPEHAQAFINGLRDDVQKFSGEIGRIGLTASQAAELAESVGHTSEELKTVADNLKYFADGYVDEGAGVEDMYWASLRYLLARKYTPISGDELYKHLRKNGLLRKDDTVDRVVDEVLGWAENMKEDALARFGLHGAIVGLGDRLAFAEDVNATLKHKRDELERTTAPVVRILKSPNQVSPTPTDSPTHEEAHQEVVNKEVIQGEPKPRPNQHILDFIIGLLNSNKGSMRQADVKKAIISRNPNIDPERLQGVIDRFCQEELLFKGKVNNGSAAYLSGEPIASPASEHQRSAPERKKSNEPALDIKLAESILIALCEPGSHYQRRLTSDEIWQKISGHNMNSRPSYEVSRLIKTTCRLLNKYGILETGEARIGVVTPRTNSATSSKGRRSSSNTAFKIGLTSQEVKERVVAALQADGVGIANLVDQMRIEREMAKDKHLSGLEVVV